MDHEPSTKNHIQRMLPRHFKMLDLKMAGMTDRAIAEMVGCTPQSVGIIARSPLFKAELNRRLKERNSTAVEDEIEAHASKARSVLEGHAERAATVQGELLECDDDSVRLRASGSILDRVLGKPEGSETSGGTQVNVQINAKDAQVLITALKESKEIRNGQDAESAADCASADPSENGQSSVHQETVERPRLGHRQAEAQAAKAEVSSDPVPDPDPNP
jgi:hypothetical protein